MSLRLGVAQLNFVVGDLAGNAQKIITTARQACTQGVHLLLTPELSICGYAAEDLFLRPGFIAACDEAVQTVARELADLDKLTVVVGHPAVTDDGGWRTRSVMRPGRYNAASVLRGGRVIARYAKRELPNYQVFDERRYFVPGDETCVFDVEADGVQTRVGLLICEDAWYEMPARETHAAGAELLAVINASPFHAGKGGEREIMMKKRVQDSGLPLVYAHLVGGQDEVVFEGHSFALQADGALAAAPTMKNKGMYTS